MKIVEYIKNMLNSIGFYWIESKLSKKEELDKISSYYEKIGKKPPIIQIKDLKKR
jgi:hypothetical protein